MFGWFGRNDPSREFRAAYEGMQTAASPEAALAHAEQAMTIASQLDPWPFRGLDPRVASAIILATMGASHLAIAGERDDDRREQALQMLEEAARRIERKDGDAWTVIQFQLLVAYRATDNGRRGSTAERSIEIGNGLLSILSKEREPERWSAVMSMLGDAYGRTRVSGGQDVPRSIASHREALGLLSKQRDPEAWTDGQVVLATALMKTQGLERKAHIEEAIVRFRDALEFLSPEAHGSRWAIVTGMLADAYAERLAGPEAENIETAIRLQEHALTRLDQRAEPVAWFSAMRHLAISYGQRLTGSRADNVEHSIGLIEQALVICGDRSHPKERPELLGLLANATMKRLRGTRRENLDRAIDIYESIQVRRPRDENPEAWARVEQNRLQAMHERRSEEGRAANRPGQHAPGDPQESPAQDGADAPARPDIETYVAQLKAEIADVDPAIHPETWANGQLAIGDAWLRFGPTLRTSDDFFEQWQANCHRALDVFQHTLAAVPRELKPLLWVRIQREIARAWTMLFHSAELIEVGPTNLAQRARTDLMRDPSLPSTRYLDAAIAANTAALEGTIGRGAAFHMEVAVELGRLQVWRRDWAGAASSFESAGHAADRLLGTVALSDEELLDALRTMGEMATLGPFACIMQGELERGLNQMERGRARLLAKALMFQTLQLPPDVRARVDRLRTEIHQQEKRLLSPVLFDRLTPLEASIRAREELAKLIGDTETPLFVHDARQALLDITHQGDVVVIPVLTYVGGRIIVACTRDGQLETHAIESASDVDLSRIFDSPLTGARKGWQTAYYQFQDQKLSVESWNDTVLSVIGALGASFAAPLMTALDSLDVPRGTQLHIVPQAELGLLPLAIGRDSASGNSLLDRYAVSFTPSLTALRHALTRADRDEAPASLGLVVHAGGQEGDRGWLRWSSIEQQWAERWFIPSTTSVVANQDATPSSALGAVRGRDVWHFVAHGIFDPRAPVESGIVLEGRQRLTVRQVLDAGDLGAPRLVILSACETALYDLEDLPGELMGLPSAFMHAGAAGVIATLWPVEDVSTSLLIGRFYEAMLGEGAMPAAALRTAQHWLRDATFDDLQATLERWQQAGRGSSESAWDQIDALRKRIAAAERHRPFASPLFWGGFVHYGA